MRSITKPACFLIGTVLFMGCNDLTAFFLPQQDSFVPATLVLPQGHYAVKKTDKVFVVELIGKDKMDTYYEGAPKSVLNGEALSAALKDGNNKYNKDFVVIIKPKKTAAYSDITDVLDMMNINKIKRYSLEN